MGEAGLDTLLEGVHDVHLHRGGQEDEADIRFLGEVAEHVEYLVEEELLGSLYIVVDVLEDEEYGLLWLLSEVLLDGLDHLHRLKLCALL